MIWQEVCAYSPTPLGLSSAPGNPFWPRGDVFRGSSRREYKAHPFLLHILSLSRMPLRRPSFAGVARTIGEVPLGLVHLGFHFGRVLMGLVEVAGLSTLAHRLL